MPLSNAKPFSFEEFERGGCLVITRNGLYLEKLRNVPCGGVFPLEGVICGQRHRWPISGKYFAQKNEEHDWDLMLVPTDGALAAIRDNNPIMRYFAWEHLPEDLQRISQPIAILAGTICNRLPDGPEKSAGLRKLLEAKDCFVRAALR